jgi:prepilin-type N-terminal cleavage/methylation domain-containing protein
VFSFTSNNRSHRARGFSLVEMLVATAIFAVAAAVAFILYDAAQKSYKLGENLSDQQQATRVAFDRMVSDLRLAGFNFNPDGDTTRVDEQVEGAWDTAVTIRGDFDFEDPAASATPETALAGTNYEIVSTGNDEIVTYALSKSGASDNLVMRLDPDRPRAAAIKTVTIPNIALVQDDPPYTLYRISLIDVAGAFPASPQAASSYVYEPVADNIRTMTFRYYDDSGAELGPNTPGNSADDLGGADAGEFNRSKIRKITVSLVGMTEDEDLRYTDVSDASATSHYRKFDLTSDVYAENLGRIGVRDLDITPPARPTNVSLVPGHCDGMLVKWDAPASSEGITSYTVKYWVSGSPATFTTVNFGYPHVEFGVIDFDAHAYVSSLTDGVNTCFAVQAKDGSGNVSSWGPPTNEPCAVVTDASTPDTPLNLVATGDGTLTPEDSKITLSWDEVQTNDGTVTNDPDLIGGKTIFRDGKGYKLYRSETNPYTPSSSTLHKTADDIGYGATEFIDGDPIPTPNCRDFYYMLKAVDWCGTEGLASNFTLGRSETTIAPEKPAGLSGSRTSKTNVALDWTAVTLKVDGTATTIDVYKIYRAKATTGTSPGSIPLASYALRGSSNTNSYGDAIDQTDHVDMSHGYSFYYVVSAADLCGNESEKSDPVEVECKFDGTFITDPADGDSNGGIVPIDLDVSGLDSYVRARVRIPDLANSMTYVYDQETFTHPFIFPAWDTNGLPAGDYTIEWEVENQQGCIKSVQTTFAVTANLACQITPTNPNLSPTTGKPSNQNKVMTWDIINNAGKDLDIFQVDISWTSVLSSTRRLVSIEYPAGNPTLPSFLSGPTSPVIADYSMLLPLLLPMSADGLCGNTSCIMTMALAWDEQIVNSSNVGELVTVRYHFMDPSSATGTCEFSVKPDLTIVSFPESESTPLSGPVSEFLIASK